MEVPRRFCAALQLCQTHTPRPAPSHRRCKAVRATMNQESYVNSFQQPCSKLFARNWRAATARARESAAEIEPSVLPSLLASARCTSSSLQSLYLGVSFIFSYSWSTRARLDARRAHFFAQTAGLSFFAQKNCRVVRRLIQSYQPNSSLLSVI